MTPVAVNVYILMMLLAYVMRRAGTFSLDEKVKLIEILKLYLLFLGVYYKEGEGKISYSKES